MVVESESYIYEKAKKITDLVSIEYDIPIDVPDNGLFNFNMSIIPGNDCYNVAFRSADFRPPANYAGKVSFINTALLRDNLLSDIDRVYFKGYGIRLWDKYNAMEDPKLIRWRGDTWCLFTRPNFYIKKITMSLLNLNNGNYIHFDDPLDRDFTKNWMPYVNDDKFFLATDIDPLRIYSVQEDRLKPVVVNQNKKYDFLIHGSSNIIDFDNIRVGMIHGRFDVEGRWFYWHRFASWDLEWKNMKFGNPFFFQDRWVEFCVSILHEKDHVLIPYSTMDESINLIKIKDEEFRKLL